MHAILLSLLLSVGDVRSAAPDIVVVCPAEFNQAMQPWVARRNQQGHVVQFLSNEGTAEQIRDQIRSIAKNQKLRFVVLVGDAPTAEVDLAASKRRTPTFRVPTKMNRAWGGDAEAASDNPFADLDSDRVPDLAIGRLTAHTADELSAMLKKILAYEENRDFGPWRTRVNFVAGEGGYGDLAESAAEAGARRLVSNFLPASYQTTLTYANWRSPFCPNPQAFHNCCLERFNEGCLFWVFMGHGAPQTLQWAVFPDGGQPILNCADCSKLRCAATPPIACFFCCHTGAFAERENCLAEELLRSPGGPVAVLSGSNVTMPYGMAAMGWQAIGQYFDQRCPTLGQWLLAAKRDSVAGYDLPIWSLTHALTVAAAPAGIDPKEERLEHLQLFNLFGDPTMRLYHPREVKLIIPETVAAGDRITVSGECPVDGTATIELVIRDRARSGHRDRYDRSAKGREQFATTYRAANEPRLSSAQAEVRGGRFSIDLPVPADAADACYVRVLVQGADDCAVGSGKVRIHAASVNRGGSSR